MFAAPISNASHEVQLLAPDRSNGQQSLKTMVQRQGLDNSCNVST